MAWYEMNRMERYFFDISDIVHFISRESHFSGIQRATVMMIDRAAENITDAEVFVSFFDPQKKKYQAVPFSEIGVGILTNAQSLRSLLKIKGKTKATISPLLRKYSDAPVKLWYHRLRLNFLSRIGNDKFFSRRNTTLQEWKSTQSGQSGFEEKSRRLETLDFNNEARKGDSLVLLDASWTLPQVLGVFCQARERGIHIHSMIHDLIPIVAPEYFTGNSPIEFHNWLIGTSKFTSRYIANSASTANDLAIFLKSYGIEIPIETVPLAQAGLPKSNLADRAALARSNLRNDVYKKLYLGSFVSDEVRSLSRSPFVLCVGTMEVRKNIWKIAQVWDRLRMTPNIQLPKLVFAGRAGWLKQDFDNFMRATGNLYGWVEIAENPSDDELAYLYNNCLFTITASCYEGWGLPIGESLSYGKTAVVSNVSSMPEVGGNLVEYCDPMSIDSIFAACSKLIADPVHRSKLEKSIAATKLRSWDDVASDLRNVLRKKTSGKV